ncbi:heparinase II/III family protein [Paracoccus sp. SCSIO 75233]|uniref:heparinase II/III family protein n=1 Tax=Paracoccus sp. SCSIO 75233 TaxID=3017782 RepID=UPI0022F0ADE3|nr:heparinase II/III family protein [Paracoccus sp. SCSIO 75233]WBU53245.1 heparinase II/III family protein [Paracoccus sp. SCSIO 75233]
MTTTTPRPYGFTRPPEPRSLGSALRGHEILGGKLPLTGAMVEGDPFAVTDLTPAQAAELHGFGWLDDLAAVGSAKARDLAQMRVLAWIAAHPKPSAAADSPVWRADVTGRRVLRWLFHAGQILPGLDRDTAQPVFDSLHAQLSVLERVGMLEGAARVEALSARAMAAMLLKGAEGAAQAALDDLASDVETSIRRRVMRGRCPEALLSCLSQLAWVGATAKDMGRDIPEQIASVIEEIAPVLRALRHADGGLPRFHGGGRGPAGRLDHSLRAATGPSIVAPGHAMGFARLSRSRSTVMLDAAAPPAGPAAAHAHASTLAIEFTSARHPIVVNCGAGGMFGPAWARASRATACHSTLSLTGLSSAKLLPPDEHGSERLTLLPQKVWAGQCDDEGNLMPPDAPAPSPREGQPILSGHDAWQGTHGLTCLRELYLSADGDELRGEDTLAALDIESQGRLEQILTNMPDGIGYDIRFHLHPDVDAIPDGDAIRLILPGKEEWYFSHDMIAEQRLEPSAYLESGQSAPQPTTQIVLSHRLTAQAVRIGWTFMRAGAS